MPLMSCWTKYSMRPPPFSIAEPALTKKRPCGNAAGLGPRLFPLIFQAVAYNPWVRARNPGRFAALFSRRGSRLSVETPENLEKSPMSNEQQKPQGDQQQQQNNPRPNPQQGGQNKPGQQQQGGQNKPGEQHGGQKPGQGGQQSGGMDR